MVRKICAFACYYKRMVERIPYPFESDRVMGAIRKKFINLNFGAIGCIIKVNDAPQGKSGKLETLVPCIGCLPGSGLWEAHPL